MVKNLLGVYLCWRFWWHRQNLQVKKSNISLRFLGRVPGERCWRGIQTALVLGIFWLAFHFSYLLSDDMKSICIWWKLYFEFDSFSQVSHIQCWAVTVSCQSQEPTTGDPQCVVLLKLPWPRVKVLDASLTQGIFSLQWLYREVTIANWGLSVWYNVSPERGVQDLATKQKGTKIGRLWAFSACQVVENGSLSGDGT